MYTKPYIDCLPLVKIRRYSAKENYNTLIKDTTSGILTKYRREPDE